MPLKTKLNKLRLKFNYNNLFFQKIKPSIAAVIRIVVSPPLIPLSAFSDFVLILEKNVVGSTCSPKDQFLFCYLPSSNIFQSIT